MQRPRVSSHARWRAPVATAAAAALLFTKLAFAQALPNLVEEDLAIRNIATALESGKANEALAAIDTLKKKRKILPPSLLFLEAKLFLLTKNYDKGRMALTSYFNSPNVQAEKNYSSALTLYAELSKAAEANKLAELDRRLSPHKSKHNVTTISAGSLSSKPDGFAFREGTDFPEMVLIPGGTFYMGDPSGGKEISYMATPRHAVTIRRFAVSSHEITISDWLSCQNDNVCGERENTRNIDGRMPVSVRWSDAQAYVTWLSYMTGERYRLLSESEWEYAARAGKQQLFVTGSDINNRMAHVLTDLSVGRKPVGSYPPNGFGLFDMAGNEMEWVEDCFHASYDGAPSDGSPWISGSCTERVIRDRLWFYEKKMVYVVFNRLLSPESGSSGFRVARDLRE